MMKMMNKKDTIVHYFNDILNDVGCELLYKKDYELLIAVRLSAQCTDKKVNSVTKNLFSKYPTLESLSKAEVKDIEDIVSPLGLQKKKALDIKDIATSLITNFNGQVPSSREKLESLPGVGHKTAGVVMVELFQKNEFPVDTHVFRIAKRLGITSDDSSLLKCENDLRDFFNGENYSRLHHQFIHFGRKVCFARNPKCKDCQLKQFCSKN